MKLKLYMSEKCPDCVDAIEILKMPILIMKQSILQIL